MKRSNQGGRAQRGSISGTRGLQGGGPKVRLEPIVSANRAAVLALELSEDQKDLVASNAESLEEAEDDDDARPRAIVCGDRVVGFVMYDASDDHEALIYRFMIDHREQGRGYGRAALSAVIEEIASLGHVREILVCYIAENEVARRLYRDAGFVEHGLDEDGEIISRLSLREENAELSDPG